MKLYLVRHADATWERWDKPDDERPLTKAGRKEMEAVARALRDLKVNPDLILTSPLPRAFQTAEIAAAELGVELVIAPELAPGFDERMLRTLLAAHPGLDLMLVGHEPDLSELIGALTGGRVRMAKAGLARLDLDGSDASHGTLVWLLPPKITSRIG